MVASFSISACLLVFPSSSFPLFLPPSYFLYCPRPSLSHFRQLWVFFYFFLFGTAVTPCLSFPSPNLVSTLDLCTHEPSLRGASCIPEALLWFALPEVWLLVFFQKQTNRQTTTTTTTTTTITNTHIRTYTRNTKHLSLLSRDRNARGSAASRSADSRRNKVMLKYAFFVPLFEFALNRTHDHTTCIHTETGKRGVSRCVCSEDRHQVERAKSVLSVPKNTTVSGTFQNSCTS